MWKKRKKPFRIVIFRKTNHPVHPFNERNHITSGVGFTQSKTTFSKTNIPISVDPANPHDKKSKQYIRNITITDRKREFKEDTKGAFKAFHPTFLDRLKIRMVIAKNFLFTSGERKRIKKEILRSEAIKKYDEKRHKDKMRKRKKK